MFNQLKTETDRFMFTKYQQDYDEVRSWFEGIRTNKTQFGPWDEMMEYVAQAKTPSQAALLMSGIKLGVRMALAVVALREVR